MLVGGMNHPARDVVGEIRWMAELGLDFIDLTLEPPGAGYWQIDPREVRRALDEYGMQVVGHTAYFLPLGHPFEEVRRAAVEGLRHSLEAFAAIGATAMNIHPDFNAPMHHRSFSLEQNLRSLSELLVPSRENGVALMVENLPGSFNNARQIGELLDPLPELWLHLDMGHTNLMVAHNTVEEILQHYGHRLRHVHFHDNKGGREDVHLPLGAGTIDLRRSVAALKRTGYDGTITLEVFTPDTAYLRYSADKLRCLWDEMP